MTNTLNERVRAHYFSYFYRSTIKQNKMPTVFVGFNTVTQLPPSPTTDDRGGYDVDFVGGEPSHSTCCICLFILRNPMQGRECGHRFCKSCATQLTKT